ncbi:MAG: helix-turn-helix domain-containing protein [Coriobacteriia bacterium]|nr:helix-turn-helix domain-containing protein [Coriobacteriia bacterium]
MFDKKHIGSDFDEFLREEGMADEVEAAAAKRVIAFQIEEEMQRASITKSELARRMNSSRSAVDRLLDPSNPSVTLTTLACAARAIGKKISVQLEAQ